MSLQAIATGDLIALTREMASLVTADIVTAFNQAAGKEQKDIMKVILQDETALRHEARKNARLADTYNRMLCLNVLERIDYGMSVIIQSAPPQTIRRLHERAAALDGRSKVGNPLRAELLEVAGAPRLASIIRQAA